MGKCEKCIHDGVCSLKEKRGKLQLEVLKINTGEEPFNAYVDCFKYSDKVKYVPCYPYPAYYQQQPQYPVVTWYGSGSGTWYK